MSIADAESSQNISTNPTSHELIKGINLPGAIALVVGSMIGSGIFIAPSLMASKIMSPGIIILLWALGGLLTAAGAISCAELASAMPRSGGQYIFLKEAYSPLWGFLYGWALLLVIQTGCIAAVAVAFAKYLGVFIPAVSENNVIFQAAFGTFIYKFNMAQLVGILSIILLTVINCFGVKAGDRIQKVFTALKVLAIAILILLGFAVGKGGVQNFAAITPIVPVAANLGLFAALAWGLSKALFAYDAWYTVTFAADEIEESERNVPKALVFGTLIVTLIYVSATAVYFYLIPIVQAGTVPDNRIAAAAAQIIFGSWGLAFIGAAIMISTFGCNNGLILGGARVCYAMAKDKLFFKQMGEVHKEYRTPINALVVQGIWAVILTATGTFSDLLTYVTFASVLFNVMNVAAVFIMRKKRPDLPRPYKAFGYPIVPAFYLLVGIGFLIFVIQGDLINTLKGLGFILIGIPVYYFGFRNTGTRNSDDSLRET